MNAIVISCKTIEDELMAAMKELNCEYEVLWLESGLHNWPQKLNAKLQELLEECGGYDTVLLAMSFCGNALVGLHTGPFRMIVPRCDDCITLLLGSVARRRQISATYFLTGGWLRGERNLWTEYVECLKKYGEKRGKRIFSTLLANYQTLALLDTGCFEHDAAEVEVRKMAETFSLKYTQLDGTLGYLKELLSGNWSEDRFLWIPPDSVVSDGDCMLKGE